MVVPTHTCTDDAMNAYPTNIAIVCTASNGYEADFSDSQEAYSSPQNHGCKTNTAINSDDDSSSQKVETKSDKNAIATRSFVNWGREESPKNKFEKSAPEGDSAPRFLITSRLSNNQQTSPLYSEANFERRTEEISGQLNQNHRPNSSNGRRSRCSDRIVRKQRSPSTEFNSADSNDEISDCCEHAKHRQLSIPSTQVRTARPSVLRNSQTAQALKENNKKLCRRSLSEPRRPNSSNDEGGQSHIDYNHRNTSSKYTRDPCTECCYNHRRQSDNRLKQSTEKIEKSFRLGIDDQSNARGRSDSRFRNSTETDQDYQWHLIIRRTDENGKIKCLLNRKLPISSSVSWPNRVLNYVRRYCPVDQDNIELKAKESSSHKDLNMKNLRSESKSISRMQQQPIGHQNSNQAGVGKSQKYKPSSKTSRRKPRIRINADDDDDRQMIRCKEFCIPSKHYSYHRANRKVDGDSDVDATTHSCYDGDSRLKTCTNDEEISTAHLKRSSRSDYQKYRDSDLKHHCGNLKSDMKKRNKSSGVSRKELNKQYLSILSDDSVSCSSSWSDALYMDQKSSDSNSFDHITSRPISKGYAGDACSSDSSEHVNKHNSVSPRLRWESRKSAKKYCSMNRCHSALHMHRDHRNSINPQTHCSHSPYTNQHNSHKTKQINGAHTNNSTCNRRRSNTEKVSTLSPILRSKEPLKSLPKIANATEELLNEIEYLIHREKK